MNLTEIPTPGYERVVHASDPGSGLEAVISVHSTALGPSLGGIRMLPYASLEEAVADVNRLAQGMTYKAAVAETGQGGGKAVIIGDPVNKSEALFLAMGRFIDALEGIYYAAEDMNITVGDLEIVARETRWVSGLSFEHGGSGNPSPMTAWGCFLATQTCLEELFGSPSLEGRTIAIQGIGAVGSVYARLCTKAGARLVLGDLHDERAKSLAEELGADWIPGADGVLFAECDLLAPCGRGAILNADTIPRLRCKAIAGAANNQLAEAGDANRLKDRNILYAPDFVVNAGGIINIAVEFSSEGYSESAARARCQSIPKALRQVFSIAREGNTTPGEAANRLAEARIAAGVSGAE